MGLWGNCDNIVIVLKIVKFWTNSKIEQLLDNYKLCKLIYYSLRLWGLHITRSTCYPPGWVDVPKICQNLHFDYFCKSPARHRFFMSAAWGHIYIFMSTNFLPQMDMCSFLKSVTIPNHRINLPKSFEIRFETHSKTSQFPTIISTQFFAENLRTAP